MQTQKTLDIGRTTTVNPNQLAADITSSGSSNWWDQTWRPVQWLDRPDNENEQRLQNDAVLYSFLTEMGQYTPTTRALMDNPYIYYRIDTRKDAFTHLRFDLASDDVYLYVEEPKLFFPKYVMHLSQTNQQLVVEEVDYDLSETWTNGAGDVANVKVNRTYYGAAVAANAGDLVEIGLPEFGELGSSADTGMLLPGDPQFQIVTMFGWNVQTSVMQMNSNMGPGTYGTHDANMMYAEMRAKQAMQTEILHGKRAARASSNAEEGMIYRSAGLVEQIGDNVLHVDGTGNGLVWGNLSDYIDEMYVSQNSGGMKDGFFGDRLFAETRTTAMQEGRLSEDVSYNPQLGTDVFTVTTDGGKSLNVKRADHAFPDAKADWGIIVDQNVLTTASYKGFEGMVWSDNVETGEEEITRKKQVLYGSVSTIITDPSCCGVIRSAGAGVNVVRGLNESQYL